MSPKPSAADSTCQCLSKMSTQPMTHQIPSMLLHQLRSPAFCYCGINVLIRCFYCLVCSEDCLEESAVYHWLVFKWITGDSKLKLKWVFSLAYSTKNQLEGVFSQRAGLSTLNRTVKCQRPVLLELESTYLPTSWPLFFISRKRHMHHSDFSYLQWFAPSLRCQQDIGQCLELLLSLPTLSFPPLSLS